ncbi:MAG: serine/threonine-protein kinase [Myxococcota bacterium]
MHLCIRARWLTLSKKVLVVELEPDLVGTKLKERYRIVRMLGKGGMGQVYEGIDETLERKVAIKVLLLKYVGDGTLRRRFVREAKAASRVQHPNVVQIIDYGHTPDGSVFYAMEFLEGRDLRALLRERRALPWPRACRLLSQVSHALAATHAAGVIHRDIKPSNFFLVDAYGLDDFIKLIDFGIAKVRVEIEGEPQSLATNLTGFGEILGTAPYMAPEQARGLPSDPRVDVYAVGVVAYEMLVGAVPFDGRGVFEILRKHVHEEPVALREIDPSIPVEVESFVLRALAKNPLDRYGSMKEMSAALSKLATSSSRGHVAIGSRRAPPKRSKAFASGLERGSTEVDGSKKTVVSSIAEEVNITADDIVATRKMPGGHHDIFASHRGRTSASVEEQTTRKWPKRAVAPTAYEFPSVPSATVSETIVAHLDDPGGHRTLSAGAEVPEKATARRARLPPRGRSGSIGIVGLLGMLIVGLMSTGVWLMISREEPGPEQDGALVSVHAMESLSAIGSLEGEARGANGTNETNGTSGFAETRGEQIGVGSMIGGSTTGGSTSTALDDVEVTELVHEPSRDDVPVDRDRGVVTRKRNNRRPHHTSKTPMTDRAIYEKLKKNLRRKCRQWSNEESVTVELLVGSTGVVVHRSLRGAGAELEKCLLTGLAEVVFSRGEMRKISMPIRF